MSNYPLPYTALEIQGYLQKVATPDAAPVGDSDALITSGAVAEALNNFEGGSGSAVLPTREQIEELGINIDLNQIGDLDQLTIAPTQIDGDVTINLDQIGDLGNLFINADHLTGTISSDQINNVSMDNVTTIDGLTLSANTVAAIDISATDLSGFSSMVEGQLSNLTVEADTFSSNFSWNQEIDGVLAKDAVFQAINSNLQSFVDGELQNYTVTTQNLSAITTLSDISTALNNTVNQAISTSINGALDNYVIDAENINANLSIDDFGAEGSTFRSTLNTAVQTLAQGVVENYTITSDNISADFTVNGMGQTFEDAINAAITTVATGIVENYEITADNISANLSITGGDLGTDFTNAVNAAVDARIANNAGSVTISAEAITSDFDMSTFTGHADFQSAINSGVSVALGNNSGDLTIDVGNLNANFVLPIDNMDSDVGLLTGAFIENNAVKIDIGVMTGALNLATSLEKQNFIDQFQGDLEINTNLITGDISSSGNITINADVINAGTIPTARINQAQLSLGLTQIQDLLKVDTNGVAVTETQLDENGNPVTTNVINQLVIPQTLPNLDISSQLAAANISAEQITEGTLDFSNINQTGLSITAADVSNFDAAVTNVLGGTNFVEINNSTVDLSGVNVTGLGLNADDIGDFTTQVQQVAGSMGFADLSNSTLDLTNVVVSGLSVPHTAISDFDAEVTAIAAGFQLSNVTDSSIDLSNMTVTGFDINNHIGEATFNAAVTSAVGQLTFDNISGGTLELSGVTVSGQANLGLTTTHISDFQTELDAAIGSITFTDITGSTLDLTNVSVSGLSQSEVDGFDDRVSQLTANISAAQLDFIDANGDISIGTGANDVGITGLTYTHIENFETAVDTAASNLNFTKIENSQLDLTGVTLTGLVLDLTDLAGGTLPSNITVDAGNIVNTISADNLPITNGNISLLGSQTIADIVNDLTINADTISGGTLDLSNMDFTGQLPSVNMGAITIDVEQLTDSDLTVLASNIQGDINIDIEHVTSTDGTPINLVFDVDQVTGDIFIDAAQVRGTFNINQISGLDGIGLPSGVVWKEFVTLENGVPTKYWLPTSLSNPDA